MALDPTWLHPRDRSTERDAYNACKYGLRVMKRAGRTVLVRPSPDADRKLSGFPIPPKKPRPPKDRAPRWPVRAALVVCLLELLSLRLSVRVRRLRFVSGDELAVANEGGVGLC